MRIARVEPLSVARALRGPFDYLLPDGFAEVGIGTRLDVPFAGRRLDAVVVELADRTDVPLEKLASPHGVLEPGIPADLVEVALRIASSYCSTPARALMLAAPPGAAARAKARKALFASLTDEGRSAPQSDARLSDSQRELLQVLSSGDLAVASIPGGSQAARRLEKRGYVTVDERTVNRRPAGPTMHPGRVRPKLNREQLAAGDRIVAAIRSQVSAGFLLHGVTGSGKTEVYLTAAEAALEEGKSVIVLVPEIGLTPQAVARFTARLGDTVAIIHSALSVGERRDEWLRLSSGEARVCIGPRSAVFAPVVDLGLIVVDEEHESSYRNDGDPGYDAREVAAWRAERAGAVLVAGSATPRPESVRRLERLRLLERADGSQLPPVELLDMRSVRGPLHPRAVEALAQVRERGQKAIVLLNRRGWSNFLTCRGCGRVWSCPSCDVSLVLHRSGGTIDCHHCGHSESMPESCPDCGSVSVARHGAGTERIEDEIGRLFEGSGLPVIRLDADTASRKGESERLLTKFQTADGGVLIGTQMVAKGHDFDNVTLGLVLDADGTLRFPDFRAEERSFQLVAQLAGRAGRGNAQGRVLVQTISPDSEVLKLAALHDADGFLEMELERREALRYPPAAALVRIFIASEDEDCAQDAAEEVAEAIEAAGIEVLGPAPLFRLRGRHRRQLIARSTQRTALVEAADSAVANAAGSRIGRLCSFGTEVDAG